MSQAKFILVWMIALIIYHLLQHIKIYKHFKTFSNTEDTIKPKKSTLSGRQETLQFFIYLFILFLDISYRSFKIIFYLKKEFLGVVISMRIIHATLLEYNWEN